MWYLRSTANRETSAQPTLHFGSRLSDDQWNFCRLFAILFGNTKWYSSPLNSPAGQCHSQCASDSTEKTDICWLSISIIIWRDTVVFLDQL